jgi:hypothetical protein
VAVEPVAELGVFFAGAGKHGHEPAAVVVDVVHGGPVGQLAVGHVEEVGPSDQGSQLVPGGDVGDVVGGVAVLGAIRDGDRPVGGDGQDPHELFEVGAVVLVVAVGDGRGRLTGPGPAGGSLVGAGEGDGGRVVVELGDVEVEVADDAEDHLGDEGGPIGVEEPVEGATHPVVIECFGVAGREPEQAGSVRGGPLAKGVEGQVANDEVADDHADHRGRRQAQTPVTARQVTTETPGQADPVEEVVHDRQRAEDLGSQLEVTWNGHGVLP